MVSRSRPNLASVRWTRDAGRGSGDDVLRAAERLVQQAQYMVRRFSHPQHDAEAAGPEHIVGAKHRPMTGRDVSGWVPIDSQTNLNADLRNASSLAKRPE